MDFCNLPGHPSRLAILHCEVDLRVIPVSKFSSRFGERVRLVVIHTSEGARTVESIAAFCNRRGVNASYHGAVDDHRYEAYVNYSHAAWALRNGNQESDNLCLCAFAAWSRAEWLRHPRMLELTAAWIAERCTARGLPVRRLSDREVGDAMRNDAHPGGWADHDGYTKGTGDGTHWDVGENFPFDLVEQRAQHLARTITTRNLPEDDMAQVPQAEWRELLSKVNKIDGNVSYSHGRQIGVLIDEMTGHMTTLTALLTEQKGLLTEVKTLLEAAGPKDPT